MKVFLSWSGDRSKQIAEELRSWLPAVLQYVKPYFTPNDIEKGTRWSTDIAKELEVSTVGVFCLTPDNLSSSWMMFEAGALSKSVEKGRVCPLLFGVDPSDLKGPFIQFQATPFSKVEARKLLATINDASGESKLEKTVLDNVFNMWWPGLEEKITKILSADNSGPEVELRSDRDMLEEILELTRLRSKTARRGVGSRGIPSALMKDMAATYSSVWGDLVNANISSNFVANIIDLGQMIRYIDSTELDGQYFSNYMAKNPPMELDQLLWVPPLVSSYEPKSADPVDDD